MLTRMRDKLRHGSVGGQALVEMALVLPIFVMVVTGILVLGIGVFYQQQVTNAAREAARYAAVHSATAQCPTVSNLDPDPPPQSYYRCDPPSARWPQMTGHARGYLFGLNSSDVRFTACWSGYWETDDTGAYSDYDALPIDLAGLPNNFRGCTIAAVHPTSGVIVNIDPRTSLEEASGDRVDIACSDPLPPTGVANDMASSLSASYAGTANQVTVFACYNWRPPLAGFLLVPQVVTLRAVITETLQYQQ
jgi:hypothetical protein